MPKFPVHWVPVTKTSSDMSNALPNSFLAHKLKETTASPSSAAYFGPNITSLKKYTKGHGNFGKLFEAYCSCQLQTVGVFKVKTSAAQGMNGKTPNDDMQASTALGKESFFCLKVGIKTDLINLYTGKYLCTSFNFRRKDQNSKKEKKK